MFENPSEKKHPRREKNGRAGVSSFFSGVGFGCLASLVFGVLLLLLVCAVLLKTKDPARYRTVCGVGCLYAAAFAGGFFAVKKGRGNAPLLCALFVSLFWLLVTLVLSFFLPAEWRVGTAGAPSLIRRALLFPFSLLGAGLALPRKGRARKRRRA